MRIHIHIYIYNCVFPMLSGLREGTVKVRTWSASIPKPRRAAIQKLHPEIAQRVDSKAQQQEYATPILHRHDCIYDIYIYMQICMYKTHIYIHIYIYPYM